MDQDTELGLLMKRVEKNADELERMIAAMGDLGDAPIVVSRDALVETLGFDARADASVSSNLTNGALRA